MHKPQNGCFPTFLFCDLTGIRRRQELSFMPPLNFGEELKQRGIAWTKIADRQVKYSCQISEEIGRPCRWRKSDVPSACFNPWRQKTQRCLWRDLDQSKEPDVWEFLRYVFGGGGGLLLTILCTVCMAEACRWPQSRVLSLSWSGKEGLLPGRPHAFSGVEIAKEVRK